MNYFDHILAYEIIRAEGFRTESYLDTENNWTIGIGHLLGKDSKYSNIVWTPEQVIITFMGDLNSAIYYTKKQFPVLDDLTEVRQRVLVNMMLNMGPGSFSSFKNMTYAVNNFDYYTAYNEMLDSKWAKIDVPERAQRLADQWRVG